MVVMPILNPDGLLDGSPSFVLTFPTSFFILLPMQFVTSFSATELISIAGLVNAVILYILSGRMVNVFGFRRTIGVFALSVSLYSVVAWFLNDQGQKARVRIVNGGQNAAGVWIAADDDGLRVMSNQPLIPPSPFGFQYDIPTNTADDKLVFVPNETRGIAKGRQFLLKGGRLVRPYPANTYDMLRDGAVEVERIEITEGPKKGLIGWLPSTYLQRLLTIGSL
jgi:hypothetical protein